MQVKEFDRENFELAETLLHVGLSECVSTSESKSEDLFLRLYILYQCWKISEGHVAETDSQSVFGEEMHFEEELLLSLRRL